MVCSAIVGFTIRVCVCVDAAERDSTTRLAALHIHRPAATQPERESNSVQHTGETQQEPESWLTVKWVELTLDSIIIRLHWIVYYHLILCLSFNARSIFITSSLENNFLSAFIVK